MKKILSSLLIALMLSAPAFAADNLTIRDGTGATKVVRAYDDGTGIYTPVHDMQDAAASGSMTILNSNPSSGTPTPGSTIGPITLNGRATLLVQVTAIGVGGNGAIQISNDAVNWQTVSNGWIVATLQTATNCGAATGSYMFNVSGAKYARMSMAALSSGTVTAYLNASYAQGLVSLQAPLPAGSIIGGAAAHDAVISGNPVRIGARGISANYTTVSSGDTTDLITTLQGALITKPYGIPEVGWNYAAATGGISNTTTAVTIKTAAGAGLRNCITSLELYANTLGAATEVAIRDGAAGTVLWRGYSPTAGINQSMSFPMPLCGTANTLLEAVTLTATVTGGVFVNAQGYAAP